MQPIYILGIFILTGINLILLAILLWHHMRNSSQQKFDAQWQETVNRFQQRISKDIYNVQELVSQNFYHSRKETNDRLKSFEDSLLKRLHETMTSQSRQFNQITQQMDKLLNQNEKRMDKISQLVGTNLEKIQKDTNDKLEKMRLTVDEKLHKTLEDRLGETFKIVSERLEIVHRGLGEMRQLASGIGDLKKVLTNVKTRGVVGEIQLENLLQDMFSPEQYQKNVKVNPNQNYHVEFALKLPGHDDRPVWIPIDAKFPIEDYRQILDYDGNSQQEFVTLKRQFARKILSFADDIKRKYIAPPCTTNFAIMFLPIEGLYAEVLKDTALFEKLRKNYNILPAGPTTLAAFLSSLQMGFRTLAIEKRSAEVWELLGMVKTEFNKFGGILTKTRKKLQEASNIIDKADRRTRVIKRKLKDVEVIPEGKKTKD